MNRKFLLYSLLLALTLASCTTCKQEQTCEVKPKNVILHIGDGMGLPHVVAAMAEREQPLNMERCTHTGLSKTYSASHYVTDSGAGGTAIACGVKTNNNMIGMDQDSVPAESVLEVAERNGLSTGVVVTCGLTHATPAAFIAHQIDRHMSQEIALDFLSKEVDVCIGGDRAAFEKREDGRNLLNELKDKGYTIVNGIDSIMAVKDGKLFGFLQGNAYDIPKMPERGDVLPKGVQTAVNILSQNDKGFFLMVEGSQIDWGAHANDMSYLLSELYDFDEAVGKAIDFAEKDGETLVIVTADHETGGLTLVQETPDENISWQEMSSYGAARPQNRKYIAKFSTTGHSGCMVPVYAYGPGAEEFTGIMENTAFKNKILKLLNIQ